MFALKNKLDKTAILCLSKGRSFQSIYRIDRFLKTRFYGEKTFMARVNGLAQMLSQLVQIKTVNDEDSNQQSWGRSDDEPAWLNFVLNKWAGHMMRMGISAKKDDSDRYFALRVPGKKQGGQPVIFHAHIDTVGASNPNQWTHPPFGGNIADDKVWGRGTTDMKGWLVCCWQAMLDLLMHNKKPNKDVILLITTDEETGGEKSMQPAMDRLKAFNPLWCMTEGGFILPNMLNSGIYAAAIAVAEKTKGNLEIRFSGPGGHGSLGSQGICTADKLLEQILRKLHRWKATARLDQTTIEMMLRLYPHTSGIKSQLLKRARNKWVQKLLLKAILKNPVTAAMVQDIFTVTMIKGGTGHNVSMSNGSVWLDCRTCPDSSLGDLAEQLHRIMPPGVEIHEHELPGSSSQIVTANHPFFLVMEQTVQQTMPHVDVTTPMLFPAGTDGRWAAKLGIPTLRFSPFHLTKAVQNGIHGVDEHLPIDDLVLGHSFFYQIFQNL